jgi:hypothetical protein
VGDPERFAMRPVAIRDSHQNRIAGCGFAPIDNVACKNPGMAARGAVGRFAIDGDSYQVLSVRVGRDAGDLTQRRKGRKEKPFVR